MCSDDLHLECIRAVLTLSFTPYIHVSFVVTLAYKRCQQTINEHYDVKRLGTCTMNDACVGH